MTAERLKDILIGLGFIAVQLLLFRHLKFFGTQPDLPLLYLIWLMTRRDRFSCIIVAAILGFTQDALLDLWGLHLFSKVALTFFAFHLVPKISDVRLLIWQTFMVVLLAALGHNIIFLTLSSFIKSYATDLYFWRHLIGDSIYTAVVGSFLYLFITE